jgi:hypothetical protein
MTLHFQSVRAMAEQTITRAGTPIVLENPSPAVVIDVLVFAIRPRRRSYVGNRFLGEPTRRLLGVFAL